MNVNRLHSALDCIGYSGNTLSNEQWIVLHNSLIILQTENHFKNIYLWGIVLGQEADYIIAYGYEKDALLGRKFYYSLNCLDWGLVPSPTEDDKRLTQLCSMKFQGDPALVIEVFDDTPSLTEEEIERMRLEACAGTGSAQRDVAKNEPGTVHLKEEDRLAATIEQINQEAVVVPRGALWKDPCGNISVNLAFEGIPPAEARELRSFMHYRKPLQKWNTNLITRKDYNYNIDFLDTIDRDIPLGCWSVQYERGGRLALARSLFWPGMTAYHWTDTSDWGYLYVGNGRKNWDVPFMVYA